MPPTPSRPGPTCVPITGPTSDMNSGGRAHDPLDLADQLRRLVRRLDVLYDPCVGAVLVPLLAYSTIRWSARALVRTRSIGVISCSNVRIGLILSAVPSHADAAPIRPPRRRYSSVSTANHIFSLAGVVLDAQDLVGRSRRPGPRSPRRAPPVPSRRRASRSPSRSCDRPLWRSPASPWPVARSRPFPRSRLRCGSIQPRAPGRPGARTRPGNPDRRLRGRGQPLGRPQPVIEGVEAAHVGLPFAAVAPVDVEADEPNPVALDEFWRQVARWCP